MSGLVLAFATLAIRAARSSSGSRSPNPSARAIAAAAPAAATSSRAPPIARSTNPRSRTPADVRFRRCAPRPAFPQSAWAQVITRASTSRPRAREAAAGSGSATRCTSARVRSSTGSIWFTLFDADAAGPRATKVTVPAAEVAAPTGAFISVGGAVLEPGAARGELEHARARGELGPAVRGRAGGLPASAVSVSLQRAAAQDQVPLPLSRRPLHGRGHRRGRAVRARGLAGHDRPQLGGRARRALDVDPGERVRRPPGLLRRRARADQGRAA